VEVTKDKPSNAKARKMASPIPSLAPVTKQTFPIKEASKQKY
jgi:hypothetical protein